MIVQDYFPPNQRMDYRTIRPKKQGNFCFTDDFGGLVFSFKKPKKSGVESPASNTEK
jgi:hypothetical protein